ncbi:MAG: hypothetical protein I3270_00230 [Candidatus Moeniiplasma glomeromycotorum]|nr:hypothetical protein [Candidatus Moeniiplasma glomeromycotorum]MCE8162271.1 hypothetical protein [Candidatus Moeniiplasma glomeromycotorum]MCE8166072.1 hypothetical protein [Candidatus Moeniiplasma glomeromycotorum]MCE8166670.1 hypothetical protein [Candidatus Moeniiplasma glomeromycotorum]
MVTNYESLINIIPTSFINLDYYAILEWFDKTSPLGKKVTGWTERDIKLRYQAVNKEVQTKKASSNKEDIAYADYVAKYVEEAKNVFTNGYEIKISSLVSFDLNKNRYDDFLNKIKGGGKAIRVRRIKKTMSADGTKSTFKVVEPADIPITLHFADETYRKNAIQQVENLINGNGIKWDDLVKTGYENWRAKINFCILKEAIDQFREDFVTTVKSSSDGADKTEQERKDRLKRVRQEIENLMQNGGDVPLNISDLGNPDLQSYECKNSLEKNHIGEYIDEHPCKSEEMYQRLFGSDTFDPNPFMKGKRFSIRHLKEDIKEVRGKKRLLLNSNPKVKELENLIQQLITQGCQPGKVNDANFDQLSRLWDQVVNYEKGSIQEKKAYQFKLGEINSFRNISAGIGYTSNGPLETFLIKRLKAWAADFRDGRLTLTGKIIAEVKKYSLAPAGSFQKSAYSAVNDTNTFNSQGWLDKIVAATAGGGGGGPDPDSTARQDVLNRIKVVLQGAKSGYFANINNILNGIKVELEARTGTKITDHENHWLDRIYRTIARKDLEKEAVDRGGSNTDYGVGDLKTHLQGFSGKDNIEKERDRLINILKNRKTDRLTEVETAITEIRSAITNARMNSKTEKDKLGDNWEAEFKNDYRHKESSEITTRKNQLLDIINRFVAESLVACQTIFESLEKSLRENGLNESVLGINWKNNFHGQNEDEREAERNRLMKLIEKAIEAKNISEQEKEKEKKKLAQESAQAAKTAVKAKLTQSHPKLVVKESEIPSEVLAPYKTIEEKLAHCASVEEVEQTETKILSTITQQRTNKLNTIRSSSINNIKKSAQGVNIQWGANKDFEKAIQGMVDPDEIEKKEKYLLKIIQEQKMAQQKDKKEQGNKTSPTLSSKWPKVLGISALIVIPLGAVVGAIVYRQRIKQRRRRG